MDQEALAELKVAAKNAIPAIFKPSLTREITRLIDGITSYNPELTNSLGLVSDFIEQFKQMRRDSVALQLTDSMLAHAVASRLFIGSWTLTVRHALGTLRAEWVTTEWGAWTGNWSQYIDKRSKSRSDKRSPPEPTTSAGSSRKASPGNSRRTEVAHTVSKSSVKKEKSTPKPAPGASPPLTASHSHAAQGQVESSSRDVAVHGLSLLASWQTAGPTEEVLPVPRGLKRIAVDPCKTPLAKQRKVLSNPEANPETEHVGSLSCPGLLDDTAGPSGSAKGLPTVPPSISSEGTEAVVSGHGLQVLKGTAGQPSHLEVMADPLITVRHPLKALQYPPIPSDLVAAIIELNTDSDELAELKELLEAQQRRNHHQCLLMRSLVQQLTDLNMGSGGSKEMAELKARNLELAERFRQVELNAKDNLAISQRTADHGARLADRQIYLTHRLADHPADVRVNELRADLDKVLPPIRVDIHGVRSQLARCLTWGMFDGPGTSGSQ